MHRKAQTATEYLIILAVVIIIALIVVGVMGGIPGIGRGAGSRASAAYWKTADIAISSYSVDATDNLVMNIRNNLPTTITLSTVTFTSASGTDTSSPGNTYTPGQTRELTATLTNSDPCTAAGDSFSLDVIFSYTDQATNEVYTFSGEGNKLEGTCAT